MRQCGFYFLGHSAANFEAYQEPPPDRPERLQMPEAVSAVIGGPKQRRILWMGKGSCPYEGCTQADARLRLCEGGVETSLCPLHGWSFYRTKPGRVFPDVAIIYDPRQAEYWTKLCSALRPQFGDAVCWLAMNTSETGEMTMCRHDSEIPTRSPGDDVIMIYHQGRFAGAVAGLAGIPRGVFAATSQAAWALKGNQAAAPE
jgi:hypothetical protein